MRNNISLPIVDQAIVSGFNFIFGILIARFIGIEEFGIYSLIWIGRIFGLSIQEAYVTSPMMTLFSSQEHKNEYLTSLLIMGLMLTSVLVILSILLGLFLNSYIQILDIDLVIISILAIMTSLYQDVLRRILLVNEQLKASIFVDFLTFGGQVGLLIFLFFKYSLVSLNDIFLIVITSSLVGFFVALCFVSYSLPSKIINIDIIRKHVGIGNWLALASILRVFSGQSIYLMSGFFLGPVYVGILKATNQVVMVVNILYQGLENFLPRMMSSQFQKNGQIGLSILLNKSIRLGLISVGSILLLISFFSTEILLLLYGKELSEYSIFVWLWSLSLLIMYLAYPMMAAMRVINKSIFIFKSYAFGAIFILIALIVVVPVYKGIGAIAVHIMSNILIVFLMYAYYKKDIK